MRVTELVLGLVLERLGVLAEEFVVVAEERAPVVELVTVLVTVLESVVVLGCTVGAFNTASGEAFVSSKEALSDVPDTVFSVVED